MLVSELKEALLITVEKNHIDALNCEDIYQEAVSLIVPDRPVIWNLKNVSFVDSSGLGKLLSITRQVHQNNQKVFIVEVNPTVMTLFRMVQLEKLIPIFETKEDAFDYIKS